jgi:alpha-glucoside transport system substrate-binding protein
MVLVPRPGMISRAATSLLALSVFASACGGGGAAQPTSAPAAPTTAAAPKPTTAPAPSVAPAASPAGAASPSAAASPAAQPAASPAAAASPSPVAAVAAAPRPPLQRIGGTVSVLGTWTGDEQDSFKAMVKPFEDATGVTVSYEGTRDLTARLTTSSEGGNLPDLAGLPGPGQMAALAKAGKLVDLTPIIDQNALKAEYSQDWITLGTVNGKLVGIFIKAAVKGSIWYNAKTLPRFSNNQTPKTWDELTALSQKIADSGTAPWCIGFESGAASGWPGTDWMEDIVLRQAGADKYDQWWGGTLAWSSPEIKTAFQTFGQIVGNEKMVYGGRATILSTAFGDAGNPLFTNPPQCYLHHQGSFITDFFIKGSTTPLKPVDDFNFFPFPDVNPQYAGSLEVAGDLFGMFKDTPQSRALISYLTSPEAQTIWVKRGGALSPDKAVSIDQYPDQISKQLAQALVSAKTVRFDASDQMPDAMNTAFFKGILDFVQTPGNLDSILASLDRTRADAYK